MYKQKTLFGLTLALIAMILGTALAMWSETLRVNVAVNTGEVKVKFLEWSCSDTGADPQAPGFHNEEGKDVASCGITIEKRDDEGNAIKLLVTIDNAYPGYSVDVNLVIQNIGTIPVKLSSYSISPVSSSITIMWRRPPHTPTPTPTPPPTPPPVPPVSVQLDPPINTQMHEGETSNYILHITVNEGAEELETYQFEVTLVFAQWNKVP